MGSHQIKKILHSQRKQSACKMKAFSSFYYASKLTFRIFKEVKNIKSQRNPPKNSVNKCANELNRQFSEEVKMDNNSMKKNVQHL